MAEKAAIRGAGADDFSSEGVDAIDGGSGQDEAGFYYFFETTDFSFVLTDSATPATVQGNGTTVVNVEAITFFGGSGNDRVETLDGEDGLYGRRGADTLSGGGGNDLIEGGQGLDNLSGGKGDDFLEGAQGRDVLDGGRGDDALEGGSTQRSDFDDATDTFRFEGNFGKDDVYEFQDGSDWLLFVGYTEDDLTVDRSGETVTLTLDNGTKSGTVTILGFEGTFNASDYDFA